MIKTAIWPQSTDPNNNVTRYLYDLDNRQTQVTDALGSYAGDPAHTTTVVRTPWATPCSQPTPWVKRRSINMTP